MTTATDLSFGEIAPWQSMLDRHSELFLDMVEGSRIGFVSREASGILPGKHLDGVKVATDVPLLAWQKILLVEERQRLADYQALSQARLADLHAVEP